MIKYLIIIIFVAFSLSQDSGGSLAFMNISPTAKSRALGNTAGSEIHNPTSLLYNPANIWQYSKFKCSFSTHSLTYIPDIESSHIFTSIKRNNWTFASGFIDYGVKSIEQYNDEAVFIDYFDYSSQAAMFGLSNKISNFVWGIGLNSMNEVFSKGDLDPIDYKDRIHIGFDLGISFFDIKLNESLFISTGMSNKAILKGTDNSNSAYSTTNAFFKVSGIFDPNPANKTTNKIKFSLNGFSDIQIQQYLNRFLLNMGLQANIIYGQNKCSLNLGLSNIPLVSEGSNYNDYISNNKKFSFGFSLDVPGTVVKIKKYKVNLQYARVVDLYYDSDYFTISITKRK